MIGGPATSISLSVRRSWHSKKDYNPCLGLVLEDRADDVSRRLMGGEGWRHALDDMAGSSSVAIGGIG